MFECVCCCSPFYVYSTNTYYSFITILKYIIFFNKYSYIYIINDCNISKYTIPSKNYDYYGNVIINKNIHNNEDFIHEYSTINDGYVLSIKSVKILIKNESLLGVSS